MHTTSVPQTSWLSRRLGFPARALLVVTVSAALAASHPASAAVFAATSLNPANQSATVGTPCVVDVVFAVGTAQYGTTYGMDTKVSFDPTKLQVVSVTTGPNSPFTTLLPNVNSVDNVNGVVSYGATGGALSNTTFVAARIHFQPIAAGTSPLKVYGARQYFTGYGPFGIDGSSTGGSIAIVAPAPTQALTLLSGSGSPGQFATSTEYFNPATGAWQPAYLTGWHPWGFVNGTNSWINYIPSSASDPGVSTDANNPWWYLYRVRFTAPASYSNPSMSFSLKADNYAEVAINGASVGPRIVGAANQLNADLVFSQNLQPGENIITIKVGDFGGLNGFNYRIDLTVDSEEPLEEIPAGPPPDTIAPVINAPADITTEATGPGGAAVSFAATANDNVDGAVSVLANPAPGSTFPLGATTVTLGAGDVAGNIATTSFTVTVVDTTPPVITPPANIVAEATSAAGATVTFTVANASDLVSGSVPVTAAPASGGGFPLGATTVALGAADAAGNAATSAFTVTVVDTTAPVISGLTPSSATLWSPNHKMVPITLTAAAGDNTGVASLKIVSVTSSEPDNGLGDGDTAGDIQITGDLTVNLRAERSGKGDGRVYTITVEARDASGNASTKTVTVTVPKSQGGKK